MNINVQKQYNDLYAKSSDFRIFVKNMNKYTTKEIERKYKLNSELFVAIFLQECKHKNELTL